MTSTSTPRTPESSQARAWFVTTRWSVVLSAGEKESPRCDDALDRLCRTYWYPLYAYARRMGHSRHDAQDLTQGFFARLIAKEYLASAAREKGRFRTFLLIAFKRFLSDQWDRDRARKRGGGHVVLSLDTSTAETRYQIEPADDATPDRVYERGWALTLLEQAMTRLEQEFAQGGKAAEFERLKVFLTAEKGAIRHAETAAELGMSEGALRVAIHRLRKRYREVFREEIAHTVSSPEEVDGEIRYLLDVMSG